MNILYFGTTPFFKKPNPSFHLMHAMISDLLERGHSVYFIGPMSADLDKDVPGEFKANPRFHYRIIMRSSKTPKSAFVLRYLRGIKYAWNCRQALKEFMPECEVVYLQSSPTMVWNTIMARRYSRGQKLVLNVQDMFPGSSIASGVMTKRWMQQVFYRLQKVAYRKADIIAAISEDMKRKLIEQDVPAEKVAVILNWFDDHTVHEVSWEENRFVKKYLMSKDKFYVQYAGTMGYVFDYKMVIEVAKKMRDYADIEFQMIGAGSQKDAFIQAAEKEGLSNILFLPLEPQEMVSDVYSACSLCLIPLKHGIIGNSVPSKAGLLMECKRAIVTSADRGCYYADEINSNGLGVACADDSPSDVVAAILKLYNDRDLCHQMGLRGYEYGHILYSRKENMRKYIELFESLSHK